MLYVTLVAILYVRWVEDGWDAGWSDDGWCGRLPCVYERFWGLPCFGPGSLEAESWVAYERRLVGAYYVCKSGETVM